MIESLKLPKDRFSDSEINGLKLKNFIFGKNGTGKSTITKAMQNQYREEYDVRVFQGYEDIVIEKEGLNIISLGTENVKLQPEIDAKEKLIKTIESEISESELFPDNLYAKLNRQKRVVNKLRGEIDAFYSRSAAFIKKNYVNLVGPNYTKIPFESDVSQVKTTSKGDWEKAQKDFNQGTVEIGSPYSYYNQSIARFLEPVNKILTVEIVKKVKLEFDTQVEQEWVRQGIELHNDKNHCLFCGALLTPERQDKLSDFFNDAVNELNISISKLKEELETEISKIEDLPLIDRHKFLLSYESDVNSLNAQLGEIKIEQKQYLTALKASIEKRQKDLFLVCKPLNLDLKDRLEDFDKSYKALYEKNKASNDDLVSLHNTAKRQMLDYLIHEQCEKFGYQQKKTEWIAEMKILNEMQRSFDDCNAELKIEKQNLKNLKEKTVDEELAADYINRLIKGLGNQSFTLVKDEQKGEKGLYVIRDYQGHIRSIDTLSTGEKNIVAFLWFINNLKNINVMSAKPQVIVFDDPMNSNDDTTQYLIITELQKLLKGNEDAQIFVLTHNVHFYLNTRYNWWKNSSRSGYNKKTIHLIKNGQVSDVKFIENKEEDIKTSYEALWFEVEWLYKYGKPEYLLNPIRRILDTYKKFNCIDSLYDDYKEAEKLFNVNSHEIDDLEAELNGKTSAKIIEMLRQVFEKNNGIEHFHRYWGNCE